MLSAGFTLIELLIVIAIISILTMVGFASFQNFSSEQVAVKAVGETQTLIRLAQSNATSSTLCSNLGATAWFLVFDRSTIELRCHPNNILKNTYTLENAQIRSIIGSDCGGISVILPLTLSFSSGSGALTFSSTSASSVCLASASWTFTLENKSNTTKIRSFKLSRGGAIDVQ